MTTESDLFRALLDEQDMPYEFQDFKTRKCTYVDCSLNGERFMVEFHEPLDGIPGTLGAMRELTFSATENVTAEEAFEVLRAVMDQ